MVGAGEDRKNAGMSHITYKKQGGGISIVHKARGWYLNNGKCIILISKCQFFCHGSRAAGGKLVLEEVEVRGGGGSKG